MPSSSSLPSPRRRHSAAFKAQVVAECQRAGASVPVVARAHGLAVSLVRKWRRDHVAGAMPSAVATTSATAGFVALELASPLTRPAPPAQIEVELQRGRTRLKVRWPVGAAADCAAWLRGVLA